VPSGAPQLEILSVVSLTVTDAAGLTDPSAPEQVKMYDVSALNGPTASDPEAPFVPLQLPDAVHEVASVEDQVSVTDEPVTTDVALEVNVTVGVAAGDVTETETVRLAEPPAPEQLNVYAAAALNGPTVCDPEVAFVPVQVPDAVHDVASVEDQVSVTDEAATTDAALELKVTVGVGPLPPPPPQAARSSVTIKPRTNRTSTWQFMNPLPYCTGVGAAAEPSPYRG